jgi:hypothetical protein
MHALCSMTARCQTAHCATGQQCLQIKTSVKGAAWQQLHWVAGSFSLVCLHLMVVCKPSRMPQCDLTEHCYMPYTGQAPYESQLHPYCWIDHSSQSGSDILSMTT